MPNTDYLRKRFNKWQVEMEIPKDLREAAKAMYGVSRAFTKSLKTDSLKEADALKGSYVSEFKKRIQLLKDGKADPEAEIRALSLRLRELTLSAKTVAGKAQVESEALDAVDDYIAEDHGDAVATRFLKVVRNETKFVKDHYEAWAERGGGTRGTIATRKQKIRHFIEWAGEDTSFDEIDRKRAAQYIDHMLTTGLARNTVLIYHTKLQSLWQWMVNRGEANMNPWTGQDLGGVGKRGVKTVRQQWNDEQLVTLMTAPGSSRSPYVPTIHDLVRLATVTGARLDELCALEVGNVLTIDGTLWLDFTSGKTDAAVRQVPVHKSVWPMLKRRRDTSPDGFLFPNLPTGGPDNKRSWYVTKAFGSYCNRLGLTDPGLTFHSLRNTFNECAEVAADEGEVQLTTVKLIVGHKRSDITFGGYSKGMRLNLRKTLDAVVSHFSEPVMRCVRGEA